MVVIPVRDICHPDGSCHSGSREPRVGTHTATPSADDEKGRRYQLLKVHYQLLLTDAPDDREGAALKDWLASHCMTEVFFFSGPMDFQLISCTGRQREHDVLFKWHLSPALPFY